MNKKVLTVRSDGLITFYRRQGEYLNHVPCGEGTFVPGTNSKVCGNVL